GVLGIVVASTKAKNPAGFLGAATKIAGAGKDAGERVTREALDDIAAKVAKLARTDPSAAHKYLNELGDVLDAFKPKKPRELAGFLQATARLDDSKAFTTKLKKFAANMKRNGVVIPEKTMRDVSDALGELPPDKAAKYLDALDDFTGSFSSKELKNLDGFIAGSRKPKSGDPAAFLAAAKELVSQRNKGLTNEAIDMLAAKAGRGKLDVEWLIQTDLYKDKAARELFNFMAEDPKTAWNLFRRVARDPNNEYLSRLANARVRGIVGEYLTLLRGRQIKEALKLTRDPAGRKTMKALKDAGITEIVSRQSEVIRPLKGGKFSRSEIDFKVRTKAGVHGLEVKTYTKEYWEKILDAWEARSKLGKKQKLTDEQLDAVGSLDHMIKQLTDAATLGHPPFLMTSDVIGNMDVARTKLLENILMNNMPPGTNILKMPEADIKATTTVVQKLLGLK
ncbi:MAG TPA: hypothetical protein VGB05_09065, partial [Pyrinomonadaceae bacterium]